MLDEAEIASPAFAAPREVWLQPSLGATRCCIFLDANLYLDRVEAAAVVNHVFPESGRPPLSCVYFSAPSAAARHEDFVCNDSFTDFLADELVPWIEQRTTVHESYYLCGLSLSGLAAAYAALRRSDVFSGAICQSPSAWWNEEWLTQSLDRWPSSKTRLWLSVGNKEVQQGISHGPSNLFQGTTQLDSCRRLAEALRPRCAEVSYHEFAGGHDPRCWALDLAPALAWL